MRWWAYGGAKVLVCGGFGVFGGFFFGILLLQSMALDLSVLGNAKVYTFWYLCGTPMINLLQNEGAG